MIINLYINHSEGNKIGKNLTLVSSLSGTLKASCSVQNPIILFEASNLSDINYLYIPEFERFYFVNEATVVQQGLWELSCHVDVLESFKDGIKAQTAIIARQENLYNLYQHDSMFKVYSAPILDEIAFNADFSHWKYFITTAGCVVPGA